MLAPRLSVVAAAPILTVVGLAKMVPDDCVVEMVPPLTATLPAVVTLPELASVKLDELIRLVKLVPEKLRPLAIVHERVMPLVSVPADCET